MQGGCNGRDTEERHQAGTSSSTREPNFINYSLFFFIRRSQANNNAEARDGPEVDRMKNDVLDTFGENAAHLKASSHLTFRARTQTGGNGRGVIKPEDVRKDIKYEICLRRKENLSLGCEREDFTLL